MRKPIKCAVLYPGAAVWHWTIIKDFTDLQGFVGGYLEAAPICREATLYLNEVGKLHDLPPTAKWMHEGRVHDVLVGPLVAVGPPNGSGDDTNLTPKMLAALQVHLQIW